MKRKGIRAGQWLAGVRSRIGAVLARAAAAVKAAFGSASGEGYIDTGVKIIIGVVIGGVVLAGLYTLFNTTIFPTLTQKITGLFDYHG